jgi:hypothetical protein
MTSEHYEDFVGSLTPEQLESLREALLKENEQRQEETEEPAKTVSEDFKVNRDPAAKKSRSPVQAKENTWSDNGESKEIETPEFEKTPRNRPKPKVRVVNCHVCGKSSKISPELVYGEFFRCDRCIGR